MQARRPCAVPLLLGHSYEALARFVVCWSLSSAPCLRPRLVALLLEGADLAARPPPVLSGPPGDPVTEADAEDAEDAEEVLEEVLEEAEVEDNGTGEHNSKNTQNVSQTLL